MNAAGLSPLDGIITAIGGRRQIRGKWRRIVQTIALYRDSAEVDRRLLRLKQLGFTETIPSRLQLAVGGYDMLRFFVIPAARDYYQLRKINFRFRYLLRFLDDPVSMIDPIGLLSRKETIIGHLMQAVHGDPIYDLQLLDMFSDGLDDLERQMMELIAGTHPRAQTIAATIEEPDYHPRLLAYIREYRLSPMAPRLKRTDGGIRKNPHFQRAEETFATLSGFLRYAAALPNEPVGAFRHLQTDRMGL